MSAFGTRRRGNAVTDIMRKLFHMVLTKPSSRNVYNLVPDLESEITPKETADPESAAFMAVDLRKEPETILSSILPFSPWGGHGNDFRHISVIALPRPGLPWGFTLDTRATLPTLATHGQARRRQAWLSRECVWGRGSVNPFTHPR